MPVRLCYCHLRSDLIYNIAVVGGRFGLTIVQTTQLITILGGGAGYMLAANSYIAQVVEAEERTAAFGVLAGVSMLGTALGEPYDEQF